MIILIVILMLLVLWATRRGAADLDAERVVYPFFKVIKICDGGIVPLNDYCLDIKYNFLSDIPPFDPSMEDMVSDHYDALATVQRISLVANEYGNFYAAADFMYSLGKVPEIVFMETFHGIVPYLLAKIFGCKIHVFTPKKLFNIAKIPEIIHYPRIPTEEDAKKLQGIPYISFYLFKGESVTFIETVKAIEKQYAWQEYILGHFKPSDICILYSGVFFNQKNTKYNLPAGNIKPITFWYHAKHAYFVVVASGVKWCNRNIWELSMQINVFNLCKRNTAKVNYDIMYARSVLRKIGNKKLIFSTLGELPNEWNTCVRLSAEDNKEYYNLFLDVGDIEYSYVVELYKNIKVPGFESKITDPTFGRYLGFNIRDNHFVLTYGLSKLRKTAVYINDIEFIDLYKVSFLYYTNIDLSPYSVGRSFHKRVENYQQALNNAKKKNLRLMPEDLDDPDLVAVMAEFIKKNATADPFRIWVKNVEPTISALHEVFPFVIINVLGASKWRPYTVNYNNTKKMDEIMHFTEKGDLIWN